MTVFADTPRWPRHGTVWGHLVSDRSLEELHEAAARAGLADPDADVSAISAPEQSANGGAALAKFEAVVAAHAHFAVAGELAADGAKGPGSYSVNFLDALHTVDGDRLAQARIGLDTLTAGEGVQA